jgi:hypothetical protein
VITITKPGGLVIIVTLTKHENKRINNNNPLIFIFQNWTLLRVTKPPERIHFLEKNKIMPQA